MKTFPLILLLTAAPLTVLADDAVPLAKDGKTYARHLAEVSRKAHKGVLAVVLRTDTVKDFPAGVAGASPSGSPKGETVREVLKNVSGDTLGTLEITYAGAGDHKASAAAIQSWIAHRALSTKNLYDPWPYDPKFSPKTRAQTLVDRTMKAHPELLVFAIHATPPRAKVNVIIGSNIGRIGKAADEDDLRVIQKGTTNLEVAEGGERFEVELPLNDAKGHRIGALGCVFAFHEGADKNALHAKAKRIRDELARSIPDSASLFKTGA